MPLSFPIFLSSFFRSLFFYSFFFFPYYTFPSPVTYFSLSLFFALFFHCFFPFSQLSFFHFLFCCFPFFPYFLFPSSLSLSSLFPSLIPCLWRKQLPPVTSFFLSLTFCRETYSIPLTDQSLPDGCIGQQIWGSLSKHHETLYNDDTRVLLRTSFTFFAITLTKIQTHFLSVATMFPSVQVTSLYGCDYATTECTIAAGLDGIAAGIEAGIEVGITGPLVTVFTTLWFTIKF